MNKKNIESIMSKGVFSVDLENTIRDADTIMRNEKVKQVPVLEGKKFVGLITESSLREYSLKKLYDYEDYDTPAGDEKIIDTRSVMTKNVHIIYPEDSVKKAVEIMLKKKADCLPVVDWKKNLVGILTWFDVLLFLNSKLDSE